MFYLSLMGISPISYDVALMLYFVCSAQDPTTHENDDLFDILGVIQMHMFYLAWRNILNFGPNTYMHEPIDYDVILMFYFDILVRRPHCI